MYHIDDQRIEKINPSERNEKQICPHLKSLGNSKTNRGKLWALNINLKRKYEFKLKFTF